MDIATLKLFIQVAHDGRFAATARRLDLDPSAVSRAIAQLERDLGFRLFHRSTRKMALTTAGATYLQKLQPLLEGLSQAEESARQEQVNPEGRLRLTASTAFGQACLLPLIPAFQARYPDIELDLYLTDAVVDILAEQIDLACRLTSSADPALVGRKLFSGCYWLCASPDYLEQAGTPQHPDELAGHRILALNLPNYRERWLYQTQEGQQRKLQLQPRILASNALALRDLALRGTGIGLLANWLVDEDLKSGRLVCLLPEYRMTATDFEAAAWLLYPSRPFMPAKTRVMVEFLTEHLARPQRFNCYLPEHYKPRQATSQTP